MPRALERPAKGFHIRLFKDDVDYLKQTYPTNYSVVVRALVARHVKRVRDKTIENLETEGFTQEELENV